MSSGRRKRSSHHLETYIEVVNTVGLQIIVCNSIYLDEAHITSLKPRIVTFDQDNHILDRLSYSVDLDAHGRYRFSIFDESNAALAIPALVSGRDFTPHALRELSARFDWPPVAAAGRLRPNALDKVAPARST